jgi:outer membrane protein assembly factor BamB
VHRRFVFIDIIAALIVVGGIATVGVVVLSGGGGGPAASPFPTQQLTQTPTPSASPSSPAALLALGNWPTYGYDAARTRFNPAIALRPPYHVKWKFQAHDLLEFPPSIFDGSLYFCTEHGYVYCLNAANSHVRWRFHLRRGKFASTPAIDGKTVYVTSIAGRLVALDRLTGKPLWQLAGIGPIESSPLVWRDRVIFGSLDDHVYAVSITSHRIVWRVATGGPVKGSAAVLNGRIVIGSYDGALYCLGYNGHVLWRRSIGGVLSSNQFYATPALAYNTAYIGGTGDGIYAFDLGNGGLRWSISTGGYVYSSPAVWHGLIFEGSYDGYFYALAAASGRVVWRFNTGGPVSGSPTVLNGIVYVSSFVHRTWGLNARNGHVVWTFPDGEYSPVTADRQTLYLNGFHTLYALVAKKG